MYNMLSSFYITVKCNSLMLSVPLQPQSTLPTAAACVSPHLRTAGSSLHTAAARRQRSHTLSNALSLRAFSPVLCRLPALFLPRIKYVKQIHLINHIPFPLFAKDSADPPV